MPPVYRVDRLEKALSELCQSQDGAQGAVIVSVEGFVVASYPPGDQGFVDNITADSSQVAAMASTLLSLSERTLARLEMGDGSIGRLLIEGSEGSIIVVPLSEQAALTILLDDEAKIGVALYAAQRTAQQIRLILEGNAK